MQLSCEVIRESVSAALDGEVGAHPGHEVDLHLAGCDACRAWQEAAHEVTRQFRLQVAEDRVPAPATLSAAVIGATSRRLPSQIPMIRAALVVAGTAQLLVSGRLFLLGGIDDARDLGAVGVALGVGYLAAALQPRRAAGMRSIVGTAALLLGGSAVSGLVHHRTTVSGEGSHLIALTGWLLIVLLAWRTPHRGAPPPSSRRRVSDHWRTEVRTRRRGGFEGDEAMAGAGIAAGRSADR